MAVQDPATAAPGSHVDVEVVVNGVHDTRSYSVIGGFARGQLTLGVRLAENSRGGSRFMHNLTIGEQLRLTSPLQNFPLGVAAKRYALLAGGIGITALAAMAATLRRIGADYTMYYAGRSRASMALLDEIERLHGPRAVIAASNEGKRLDVPDIVRGIAASDAPESTELYACGPYGMLTAVQRTWLDHALPQANLRFETFGNSGGKPTQSFIVHLPGRSAEIRVAEEQTMLDALEEAGVEVMSDCRKGECGLCVLKVLSVDGEIDHRDVFLSDKQTVEANYICSCVSRVWRPTSPSRSTDRPSVTEFARIQVGES